MNAFSTLLKETIDRHGLFDVPQKELDAVCLKIAKLVRKPLEDKLLLAKEAVNQAQAKWRVANRAHAQEASECTDYKQRLQDKQRELDTERAHHEKASIRLVKARQALKDAGLSLP
jgi:hypothetical protein